MIPAAQTDIHKINSLKDNIKNIPTILGLSIILGDVFAIILSQFLAEKTNAALRGYFMSDAANMLPYNVNQNLFLILGLILTAILYHKSFYTSRIPWWSWSTPIIESRV